MDNEDIMEHEGIVKYALSNMYKRYPSSTIAYLKEDLIQEGWIAVLQGVATYKSSYGVPLGKWLLYCVIRYMAKAVLKELSYSSNYCDSEVDFILDTSITDNTIGEFLCELNDEEKEVLLGLINGETISDIAKSLCKRNEAIIQIVAGMKEKLYEV